MTPDPSGHLDLDQLADLLAGDQTHQPHLETCAQCRTDLAELEQALPGLSAALAALPLPTPPADLEQRWAKAVRPRNVVPLASRRARWLPVVVGGAAAAAALVVGGLALNTSVFDGDGGHAGTEAAGTAKGTTKTSSTGSDYRKDGTLLAQQLPALLAGNAPQVAVPLTAPQPARAAGASKSAQQYDSAAVPPPADPLAGLRSTSGLASCLAELTDPNDPELPLALDYASWEGQPALVVVLATSKQDKVDVLVVGSGCRQGNDALLYYARLPKS